MEAHSHQRQNTVIRTYVGLLLLTVCVFALMYAPQPMFYTLSKTFGVDMSSTALLVSVIMFFLVLSPICVGILLDRMGVRRALLLSTFLLGASGLGIYLSPNFSLLLGVRSFEAIFIPVLQTAIMVGIASMFRHMDINRALAGYVTCSLVGSLCGRILGGWCGEFFGWRPTLTGICLLFFVALFLIRGIPNSVGVKGKLHRPAEYLAVFRQKGVPSLIFAEAAGLFVFAAVGNLLPFRMAELGQGKSEGLIGLMYIGYSAGILAGLFRGPLLRLFKKSPILILFGSLLYLVSCMTLAAPDLWVLFAGLWVIAFGEFTVHSNCPGLINRLATSSGVCDRSMVNGLFLSCYYAGGLLGSYLPGLVYTHFGWMPCYALLQGVMVLASCVLFKLHHDMPDMAS